MNARTGLVAFAAVAFLGLVGLVASAASHHPATAFSLGTPASTLAPNLGPGQLACQAPVDPPTGYGGVRTWIWPGFPPRAVMQVTVRDVTTGATLARGQMVHTNTANDQQYPSPLAVTTSLHATLPAGRSVAVCFRDVGSTAITLLGGSQTKPGEGVLTVHGQGTAMALSLLFLRAHPKSLLSQVPEMFSRAALFRPGWVGAWTFWVLALALLFTFPLAGLAVARAASHPAGGDAGPTAGGPEQ